MVEPLLVEEGVVVQVPVVGSIVAVLGSLAGGTAGVRMLGWQPQGMAVVQIAVQGRDSQQLYFQLA
jgi:hypothetical protein